MDEWTLNDLLECSVCLERLDTSSKVLPCQHTFCRKCLEEIVSTHKELRCPECRILVDAQINELPPNVLLMRILEGMKNSGKPLPKKKVNSFQRQKGALITTPEGVPLTSVEGVPIGSLDKVPITTSEGVHLTADGVPINSLRVSMNSSLNHIENSKIQAAHKLSSVRRKNDLLITTPDGVPITSFEDLSIVSPENIHFTSSEGGMINSGRGSMNSTSNNIDASKIQSAQKLNSFRKRKGLTMITTPEGVLMNFNEVQVANPTGASIASLPGSTNSASNHIESSKIQPNQKQNTQSTQPFARAIYDYISKEAGDLNFRKGDTILLHRTVDAQWCQGECGGKAGIFPLSYVQVIVPLPNQVATCRALYDFRMANDEDEGCLSFRKDEVITVIRRVDENWAEGVLNDHIGIFPLAFVEMNNVAQALMKLSINSQPGPSRIAPPTPSNDESTPLIPNEHTVVVGSHSSNHNSVSHQNSTNRTTVAASTVISGTESGSTMSSSTSTPSSSSITPNSSSNASSSSNSAPNSPPSNQSTNNNPNPFLSVTQSPLPMVLQTSHITNSPCGVLPTSHIAGQKSEIGSEPFPDTHCKWPPFQAGDIPNFTQHPREKRHSFSAVTPNHRNSSTSNKHSSEVINSELASDTQNGQLGKHGSQRHRRSGSDGNSGAVLPAGYLALYSYKPQKADELELKKGGLYLVTERCKDGWFKGISYKTQKSGVFPGNYVALPKSVATVQGVRYKNTRGSVKPVPVPIPVPGSVPDPVPDPDPDPVPVSVSVPILLQKTFNKQKILKVGYTGNRFVPLELPPRASSPSARHQGPCFLDYPASWRSPESDVLNGEKKVIESATLFHSPASLNGPTSYGFSGISAASTSTPSKSAEKVKEKKEKSGLIKRLTTKKRSKSLLETASYSMDNPLFDDGPAGSHQPYTHAVHLRSGSCPSQLIPLKPEGSSSSHRITSASASARLKHREFPSINNSHFLFSTSRPLESNSVAKVVSSATSSHKKSNSLDGGDARKPRQLVPQVRERFRCIVPYPPNSEYELELKVGDIIYVHKKREDGWYKGTQKRTGRTGLFPASFVETY